MLYLFKGCGKCGGDLKLDVEEWHCFQCGHIYYLSLSLSGVHLDPVDLQDSIFADSANDTSGEPGKTVERTKVRRAARHLDPSPSVTRSNEERWWKKNRQVIYHLDQGKKIREIAEIVGKGPRQIRVVRERLRDLRSAVPELTAAD